MNGAMAHVQVDTFVKLVVVATGEILWGHQHGHQGQEILVNYEGQWALTIDPHSSQES